MKLNKKTVIGSVNSSSGGTVATPDGMSIQIPADAVVVESSGAAYNGMINVSAKWLDPTADDLLETMPGDLRGIETDGEMKLLQTFGMAAVELSGSGGEVLQIATGKKATVNFSLPSSIISSAPSTIPLWHFDETSGLWEKEGSATKQGDKYVGEVSHFSFWNCDVPQNYVYVSMVVFTTAGLPASYMQIYAKRTGSLNIETGGITNGEGVISSYFPSNSTIELYASSYNMNCAIFQFHTFQTFTNSISLGNLTIPSASEFFDQRKCTGLYF